MSASSAAVPISWRIGQMLRRMACLSDMDVKEILVEQSRGRRQFGDVAVGLGLCNPQEVWQAWNMQLAAQTPRIELNDFAIDRQAAARIPWEVAWQYEMMPVRVMKNEIVAVIPDDAPLPPAAELFRLLGMTVRFVRAERALVERALKFHYKAMPTPA